MSPDTQGIPYWPSPQAEQIGDTVEAFLEKLAGPHWLFFPGRDSSRCRVVVTLLHGNEPSGLMALFQWIKSAKRPATDIYCFVGSVKAALTEPQFSHRFVPGTRDLNRCFREPFDDTQGQLAKKYLALSDLGIPNP